VKKKEKYMKRTGFPLLLTSVILTAILILSSLAGCTKTTSTTTTTTTTITAQPIKTYTIGLCAELTGFLGAYNTATVNEAQIAVDIVMNRVVSLLADRTISLNSSLKMDKAH
jgi:ABC-type Fe3+-hydroxamate transport system substrate-binding protein